MEFRLELNPSAIEEKIDLQDPIFLEGSCFTEHMTSRLVQHKFTAFENPHGILFNPASICSSLQDCMDSKIYQPEDLFSEQGIWSSWDFHSRFSDPDRDQAIAQMNRSVQHANKQLRMSRWLIITLGSAFIYQLRDGKIVANCHKTAAAEFSRRLLSLEEVMSLLDNTMHKLRFFNPDLRIIFTVSPVRHLRDGLVDNNRSKAILLQAVHHMAEKFSGIYYFPAYELVIDDLRDYRFYAEDMVHPNYQATRYVWDKFCAWGMASSTRQAVKEIQGLRASMQHKPMHPSSTAHQRFLQQQKMVAGELAERYPQIDFSEELAYFSGMP